MICLCDKEINMDAIIKLLDESQREMKEDAQKHLESMLYTIVIDI